MSTPPRACRRAMAYGPRAMSREPAPGFFARLWVAPVRDEAEDSSVTVTAVEAAAVKLTGKVGGPPPFRGTLRHGGWRVRELRLPTALGGHDPEIVAPAEVELR